jgi:hypothetical protein
MVSIGLQLGTIGTIAIVLLIVDRYVRLQGAMNYSSPSLESFQMPVIFNGRARACGVGMKGCPTGTKCGNGLCINADPQPLEEKMPLPVLPARI